MRRREVASPVPAGCRNTLERADVCTKQLTVAPTLRVWSQHVLTGGVDAWASPAHILKRLYLGLTELLLRGCLYFTHGVEDCLIR